MSCREFEEFCDRTSAYAFYNYYVISSAHAGNVRHACDFTKMISSTVRDPPLLLCSSSPHHHHKLISRTAPTRMTTPIKKYGPMVQDMVTSIRKYATCKKWYWGNMSSMLGIIPHTLRHWMSLLRSCTFASTRLNT